MVDTQRRAEDAPLPCASGSRELDAALPDSRIGRLPLAFPPIGCILDLTEAGPTRCRVREVFTN